MSFIAKVIAGPAAFLLIYLLPMQGLPYNGRVAFATFVWAVVWWMTRPIPWAISSMLPLVVFPVLGVMSIRATTALYGQRLFFWILGITMLGYALEKHGIAKRVALRFLNLKGVANSTARLTFMYMLAAGVISMFIADVGVVGMMMPIGMSLFAYISGVTGLAREGENKSRLASFLALGTLYGAVAGGMATIAGLPHNAVGVALAESLTGTYIGWFRWMKVGFPIFIIMLVSFYGLLRYFFPPEISTIPGGKEFIEGELKKLGKMTIGEINVLMCFLCMVLLFTGPSIVALALGATHPTALALRSAVPTWLVPPAILFLLFLLPVNLKKGEGTLVWKDVAEHAPWNIILLCTGAVAMTDALNQFGFLEFTNGLIGGLGMGPVGLPFFAAGATVVGTNLFSGTAAATLFCSIFIPAAQEIGWNPASMAILVPNAAVGILFPWAGASAGTAFASGFLDMKEMIKVGAVASLLILVIPTLVHLLFAPIL